MRKEENGLPMSGNEAFFRTCRDVLVSSMRGLAGEVGSRERDFLTLGERLHHLRSRAEELAERAADLAGMTSGQAMNEVLGRLSDELEHMTGVCEMGTSRESLSELAVVTGIVADLEKIIGEFGRVVKKLSMLGISTRIESARLGSKGLGFSTLADDVEKLAATIVSHASQISERNHDLRGFVESAQQKTQGIIATQENCSQSIFGGIRENIEALSALSEKSTGLSVHISEKTREVSENVSSAVLSMQFHDIVRQQVEHVEQAMDDVRQVVDGRLGSAPENEGRASELDGDDREIVAWVGDVLELQCSQLANARERFVAAVETLVGNLRGIAAGILAMGDEIMDESRDDQGGSRAVLHRVGEGIAHVKATLRNFAAQGEELAGIMTSVATTISEMSAYVGKIEDVGSEIELIAINASIKAAHTGEEGAALGVLASAIQGLSVEARKQTDEVSRILREVAKSSNILQDNANVYYDTSQVESMAGNMDGFLEQIQEMDRQGTQTFIEIGEKSSELGEAVRDLAAGVHFHVEVADRLEATRATLEDIRLNSRTIVPLDQDVRRPERLRELFGRYTMEAERDVHETVFGGGEKRVSSDEGPRVGRDEDGLGDNVELF